MPPASRQATARSIAAAVGVMIGVAGVALVTRTLVREWDEVEEALSQINLGWVVAAVFAGLAGMGLIGFNWLLMMRRPSGGRERVRGFVWYFVGQLGKYVPGGIWPVVGRAELAVRGDVERGVAYRATLLSMFATYGAAVFVSGVAGLVSGVYSRWLAAALVIASVAGPVLLGSRLAARIVPDRFVLPGGPRLIIEIARHILVWVLIASSTWAVVRGMGETVGAIELLAITATAWLVGFVVIGVPGGIGVRESVFIALFEPSMPIATAAVIALVARVVSIVVDLLGAGLALLAVRIAAPSSGRDADEFVI